MNVIDLILVLILAAVVFLAVRKLVRDRKSGKIQEICTWLRP